MEISSIRDLQKLIFRLIGTVSADEVNMIDSDEWIRNVLSSVADFASEEYQRRVWLKGLGPEQHSYVEAVCNFFDDFGASALIDQKWHQAGITEEQRRRLADLRDALDAFNASVREIPDDAAILSDPRWPRIRDLAGDALAAFAGTRWATTPRR